ncbi:hypothetical protein TPHA_0A02760 [Tetrapisispora phaffii CBS 4417]|uniref:Protein kinase domain-containing protein n=1 Tax=Tetrapisispora phaffii (strain ATCC 24235 / CBS 4417 / NBRC 1672 / NRRL Y-8282 / UCD 70-5) TaxID=1071381 RepID=G8BN80_TETPH|nr:hypothetical protein TPHA_0A02760 [Tetrapisispora phaffii CBS 4417]CCE61358.1 hypothetical protein TPHA_0A02760 [Tetrapisispora phaffii CBS 4417]
MDSNLNLRKDSTNLYKKQNNFNSLTKSCTDINNKEFGELRREESYNTLSFKPKRLYTLEQGSSSKNTLVNKIGTVTDSCPKSISDGFKYIEIPYNKEFKGTNYYKNESPKRQEKQKSDHIREPSRESLIRCENLNNNSYSPMHETFSKSILMCDEYIPDLNYKDVIENWKIALNDDDNANSLIPRSSMVRPPSSNNKLSCSPSSISYSSASLSSLNDSMIFTESHAQVEPIPFPNINTKSSREHFDSEKPSYKPIDLNFMDNQNYVENNLLRESVTNNRTPHKLYTPLSSLAIDRQLKLGNKPSAIELDNPNSEMLTKYYSNDYFVNGNNPNSYTYKSVSSTTGRRHSSATNDSFRSVSSSISVLPNSLNGNNTTVSMLMELAMRPEEIVKLIGFLPGNFMLLPYTQRKKLLIELKPEKNYKQLMNVIKKFMLTTSKSNVSLRNLQCLNRVSSVENNHQQSQQQQQQQPELISPSYGMNNSVASQYLNSFSPSVQSSFQSNFNANAFNDISDTNASPLNNYANMGTSGTNRRYSISELTNAKNLESRPDDKGEEILNHVLGKIIGFGAWGLIRECFDLKTGKCRAIKIIRFRNNEKLKKQVLREVKIWNELKHEFILPLINWKLYENYAMFCLTERVYDGTLYDLVITWDEFSKSRIEIEERCNITALLCSQVAKALSYMHSQMIVHGDIKLENCLLIKDSIDYSKWKVMVCDFGMSCHFGSAITNDERLYGDLDNNTKIKNRKRNLKNSWFNNCNVDPYCLKHANTAGNPVGNDAYLNNQINLNSRSSERLTGLSKILKPEPVSTHSSGRKHHLNISPKSYTSITNTPEISLKPSLKTSTTSKLNTNRIRRAPTITIGEHDHTISHSNMAKGPDPHTNIGSLPYAAPELVSANSKNIDPPADIWALGVLIYTMLVGKLPFKNDYNSRLGEIIQAGNFDRRSLQLACNSCESDNERVVDESTKKSRTLRNGRLYEIVIGSLTVDLDKRWSLERIENELSILYNGAH